MNEPTTHYHATSGQSNACAYCQTTFAPRRKWERFCSSACRMAYDVDIGAQGVVRGVRRVKTGVSVTIHLTDESAAERGLKLGLGEPVRVVRQA